MKKIFFLLLFFLLILSVNAQSAQQACVYFFYGNGCPHCAKVEPFLEQLEQKYNYLKIKKFEVYDNRENLLLLNNYFNAFNVPENNRGVPVVFLKNKYLVGDTPIIENLEKEIIQGNASECPSLNNEKKEVPGILGPTSSLQGIWQPSFILTVIGAALVDSINPCAIAVLLILLSVLLATGNRRKALIVGFSFILSIYVWYFLFGLGLFSALQVSGLSYWFYKIVGLIAIIVGLANIKDYISYGAGGFVMEIPRSWRPTLKKILSGIITPIGAFIAGFIVCLFELPCTGGPYIFILGLLAEKTTFYAAIPILLIYNLFFVAPLILITLLLYFGFTTTEKANEWKERNLRLLHLIAGIILLVLGLAVVLGLI